VKKTFIYVSACLCLGMACGSSEDDAQTGDSGGPATVPGQGSEPPTAARPPGPAWVGVYEASGVWDLSGPITKQRTLGDVVADLMVDKIVELAHVPSRFEDRATDEVRDLVGDRVKEAVDTRAPAELRPGSPFMKTLATVLTSADVASTITLTTGEGDEVKGSEELRGLAFTVAGHRLTLAREELLGGEAPVGLGADLHGRQSAADTISLEPHAFGVRYGKLLLWVAARTIDDQQLAEITQGAAAALECELLTRAILGDKDELRFGVGFASFSVGADTLNDGCRAVMGDAQDRALGLFDLETPVQVGGDVQFLEDHSGPTGDRLKSKPGYGGIVDVVTEAVAPRLDVSFEGRRR